MIKEKNLQINDVKEEEIKRVTNRELKMAICYDFDKTLSPDDMQTFTLIPSFDIDADRFWAESNKLAKDNLMDNNLAWMFQLIKHSKFRDKSIKKEYFRKIGKDVKLYKGVDKWFDKINDYYHCHEIVPDFHRIHTVAVCSNVRANLKKAWPDLPVSIMNYGLPDFYQPDSVARSYGHPIIFAVVGSVIHLKAQDIFVKAAICYNKVCDVPAEFWIIGSGSQSEYFTSVMSMAENTANIIWKGELTREEIEAVYPQINVIVCPSRQEGIPIVVNEGLMNAKVCIVADTAGDNDYIVDGESGFFFHSEDADELADKMAYVAENYDNLGKMRQKARQVYVDHYSMEPFRTRLEKEIRSAIDEWQPDEKHSIFCCQDQD